MKIIKALGPVALLAVIATTLLGPSSAMAENTALCETDENPCALSSQVSNLHLSGEVEVLTSTMNYHCDALFSGKVSGLGAPQEVEGAFTYSNCNNNCVRTEENGPAVLDFLRTGHESAEAPGKSLVHVDCSGFIDCSYTLQGIVGVVKGSLLSSDENGEITFNEQSLFHEAGGFLCPKTGKLDGKFTPLSPTYISS